MNSTHVAPHRPLGLTTPLTKGPDVTALQEGLRALLQAHKIDWLPLTVDGVAGPQTIHAARFLTWAIGLGAGHRTPIQKHGRITEATQRLLRNPEKRSALDKQRAKARSRRLRKIRDAQHSGPAAAVAYAKSFIGTTESPYGSNRGPLVHNEKGEPGGVSFWQQHWGIDGSYWCLAFASYCAAVAGGAKISGNVCFSVAIEEYARAHTNGFVEVPAIERRPGDLTIWKFGGPSSPSDHGELYIGGGEDVGGNTSSEGGSQSNGGGVFQKTIGSSTRPESELSMVVRPLYS
jgi:hypothetical protein